MPVIDYNVSWMVYNCLLALIAVVLGYFTIHVENKYAKVFIGLVWFLFLPNTIYIFTDLEHLIRQWQFISTSLRPILVLQYTIFEIVGIITFLLAFYPFEKFVQLAKFFRKRKTQAFIFFNFLIAFGMVLGRVERINSWQVFTNPPAVITSALHVMLSLHLLGLTVLFGLLCNFIYFLFRSKALSFAKTFLH